MKIPSPADSHTLAVLARMKHVRQAGEQSKRNRQNGERLIVLIRCEDAQRGRARMLSVHERDDLRAAKQAIARYAHTMLRTKSAC